jgi:hypothetical protein
MPVDTQKDARSDVSAHVSAQTTQRVDNKKLVYMPTKISLLKSAARANVSVIAAASPVAAAEISGADSAASAAASVSDPAVAAATSAFIASPVYTVAVSASKPAAAVAETFAALPATALYQTTAVYDHVAAAVASISGNAMDLNIAMNEEKIEACKRRIA